MNIGEDRFFTYNFFQQHTPTSAMRRVFLSIQCYRDKAVSPFVSSFQSIYKNDTNLHFHR